MRIGPSGAEVTVVTINPQESVIGDVAMKTIESVLEYITALQDSGLVSYFPKATLEAVELLLATLPDDPNLRVAGVKAVIGILQYVSDVSVVGSSDQFETDALIVEVRRLLP